MVNTIYQIVNDGGLSVLVITNGIILIERYLQIGIPLERYLLSEETSEWKRGYLSHRHRLGRIITQ